MSAAEPLDGPLDLALVFAPDEGPLRREGFTITNDEHATWACRIIRRNNDQIDRLTTDIRTERARLDAAYQAELSRLDAREERIVGTYRDSTAHMKALLADYMDRLRADNPKLTKHEVAGGTLKVIKGRESVEVDDEFVPWAQQHRPDLVRVKVEPDRNAFKAAVKAEHLSVGEDGSVCNPFHGEVFPGIRLVRGDDRFDIDLGADL